MEYIALIVTILAIVVGSVCGIVQNILRRRKKCVGKSGAVIDTRISDFEVVCVESSFVAGNIALIENRCDSELNAKIDEAFSIYEAN